MANSNPAFVPGAIPTTAQWNGYFTGKVDETNGNIVSPTFTGTILMANLPTSNAGLPPGALWNNAGYLCIA